MSGGHFDYNCHKISRFAEDLKHELCINDSEEKDRYGDYIGRHFGTETMKALRESWVIIEKASKFAREIEWLYSGDHSEESFLRLIRGINETD